MIKPRIAEPRDDLESRLSQMGKIFDILLRIIDEPRAAPHLIKRYARSRSSVVFQTDRATPLSSSEEIMWKLIEASAAHEKFTYIKDVEGYMQGEYSMTEASDLSPSILPLMRVMARRVGSFFAHPMFTRVANGFLLRDAPPFLCVLTLRP